MKIQSNEKLHKFSTLETENVNFIVLIKFLRMTCLNSKGS